MHVVRRNRQDGLPGLQVKENFNDRYSLHSADHNYPPFFALYLIFYILTSIEIIESSLKVVQQTQFTGILWISIG